MSVNVGGQIRGDDFFGREKEVERVWSLLEKQSVLLLGPRRVGKTAIMNNLLESPKDGWLPIFCDLEKCNTPREFILDLYEKLKDQGLIERSKKFTILAKEILPKIKASISLSGPINSWKDLGEEILLATITSLKGRHLYCRKKLQTPVWRCSGYPDDMGFDMM